MKLEDIINKIDIGEEWHDCYNHFVPKFIESAKSCENWQDWDPNVFHEFFERSADQCVSSLQRGYFTKEEQARIKDDWEELAPMLKVIAENQDDPQWDVYERIKDFIKQRTKQNKKAATNRIVASLQPNLLCTIVKERCLMETFSLMQDAGIEGCPVCNSNSWFRNSFILLDYFKSNIKYDSIYDICTYPWQVLDYLRNSKEKQVTKMENIQSYVNLLKANKNLVLTGAPGTGKTFLAKEIAKAMDAEIEFVQFHPSYDYTDFVEGLRPVDDGKGNISFERKDGVFKKFCKKATFGNCHEHEALLKCWDLLKQDLISEKKPKLVTFGPNHLIIFYITFNSETSCIDIANYCTVNGDKIEIPACSLSYDDLMQKYSGRQIADDNGEIIESRINYSSKYGEMILDIMLKYFDFIPHRDIVKKKSYVFVIDEINRGELSKIFGELFYAIDPGYRGEKGKVKTQYQNLIDNDLFEDGFFVPENVYILATMNDIDRSVESMDFALRRRFAWKEIKPEDRLEMLSENLDKDTCEKAIRVMKSLNKEISKTRGLGTAYQIGPAYFLKLDKEHYDGDFSALWDMHIEILLKEYLRGYSNADAKIEELKNVYFDSLNEKSEENAD